MKILSLRLFYWGNPQPFLEFHLIVCLRFSSYTAPLKPLQDMCTVSLSLVLPTAPSTGNTSQGKDGKLLAPGPDFDIEADSIVDTLF